MGQMIWRAPDELLDRVRHEAELRRRSRNDYVKAVLSAAVDPALAADEFQGLQQRLARAELLVQAGSLRRRPSRTAVAVARRNAGRGTPLAQLVADNRR